MGAFLVIIIVGIILAAYMGLFTDLSMRRVANLNQPWRNQENETDEKGSREDDDQEI